MAGARLPRGTTGTVRFCYAVTTLVLSRICLSGGSFDLSTSASDKLMTNKASEQKRREFHFLLFIDVY